MALRNYMYAKHSSPTQAALISQEPRSAGTEITCPPERALTLDDGSKVCANCADCPKKVNVDDGSPKIKVQVETEVDFTAQL